MELQKIVGLKHFKCWAYKYVSNALGVIVFFSFLQMAHPCLATERKASRLAEKNIPFFSRSATHVLPFLTTKTFPEGALKASLLKNLKDFLGLEIFIESGTNHGHTSAAAAEIFKEVHTIEIFEAFYLKAAERFRNTENLFLYWGDSGEVFSDLLPKLEKKALFYLDGHFDGGVSGKGSKNTPVLEELDAIYKANQTNSVVLIDDICDFQQSKFDDKILGTCFEGYPLLQELIEGLLKINPEYQVCFLGNALLAFPPSDEITLSPVASACAIDRLSTVTNLFSEEFLRRQETCIALAKEEERAELITYYELYASFEWEHGWRSFAALWYGILLSYEDKKDMAKHVFEKTAFSSLPGWRGDFY